MDYQLTEKSPQELHLAMSGRFTYTDNATFRQIIQDLRNGTYKHLQLDISRLEYIDSAALGMLLLLNDAATKTGISISLTGANGQIRKMLEISNFDEIFHIGYN